MTRIVTFDNDRRFNLIYSGLIQGHAVAQRFANAKQESYPFDKTRKQAKILRKFKKISSEVKDDPLRRTLLDPVPQIIKLDEEELQLLKELYEKVDWVSNITDEVVDALDFLLGSPQGEE